MKLSLTIFLLVFPTVSVWSQGGITGGLGGIDDKPKRGDNPPQEGHGGILPSEPKKKFTPVVTEKQKREQLVRQIEIHRKSLKKRIEELEKHKKAPKFTRVSDAERSIKWMEERLAIMKKQLDLADRKSAADMRDAEDAFNKKWADTAAAIKEGRKPDGMSGNKWAEQIDAYQKARAELEAEKAYLAWKLKRKREGQLKEQEEMIAKARETLKKIKDAGKEGSSAVRRLRKALLEHQTHEADIALLKRMLADYDQIQSEVRGGKSTRKDTLMKEVFLTSPYWFVNELSKVVREISLSGATKPPTKKQQGLEVKPSMPVGGGTESDKKAEEEPEGLPLPDWMKKKPNQKGFSDKDWKKAKLKALAAELAYSNRRLKVLEKSIANADEVELREYRARLEAADSAYTSAENKAKREAKIAQRAKELKDTRAKRQKEARESLEKHIDYIKKKIAKES